MSCTQYNIYFSICKMLIFHTLVCSECILLMYSRNLPAAPAYGLSFFHASTEVMESSGCSGRKAKRAGSNISTAPSTHRTQAIPRSASGATLSIRLNVDTISSSETGYFSHSSISPRRALRLVDRGVEPLSGGRRGVHHRRCFRV